MAVLRTPQGSHHPIGSTTTLGRSPDNDVPLLEPSISRQHAIISWRAGQWHLEDQGSRNGTSVNGERLPFGRSRVLRDGDRVTLGDVTLVFRDDENRHDPDRTLTLELVNHSGAVTLTEYQLAIVRALAEPWLVGGEPATNVEIAARVGTPNAEDAVKAGLRRIYSKLGLGDIPTNRKRRALCESARARGLL